MGRDGTPSSAGTLADGPLAGSPLRDVSYVLRHPEIFSSKRAFDSPGCPIPIVPLAADLGLAAEFDEYLVGHATQPQKKPMIRSEKP